MSAAEDEWVKAAMADDTLVVELLVRLRAAEAPPHPPKPLEWSVRQRRSKHASASVNPRKQAQRDSPTTPLSWSFATSLSGGSGGAGDEQSSRPTSQKPSSPAARSKVNGESERTPSKRLRKKTLVELKDEQSSLVKERRELKRELSALRLNLEKQRAANENLKRIKIELQPVLDTETTSAAEESISGQPHHTATADAVTLQPSTSNGCLEPNAEPEFMLPDLNMPFEDPCPEVVCGVS